MIVESDDERNQRGRYFAHPNALNMGQQHFGNKRKPKTNPTANNG